MTIALGVICKGNELEELQRLMDSVVGVFDTIYITTTKEKTVLDQLKTTTRVVWSHIDPQTNPEYYIFSKEYIDLRFDKARNFNFSAINEDFIMWLDSDDILIGSENVRSVVSMMERLKLDAVYCDYHYEIDPDSKEIIINHPRERIVKNKVYSWKAELHETLIASRQVDTRYIHDLFVEHWPTQESRITNIERNIRVLMNAWKEERDLVLKGERKEIDPRTEYYLARCLFDTQTKDGMDRASKLFQDYLEHSGWDEERAQAWNYLGAIYFQSSNYNDAEVCFLNAIKERPEYPTWHIGLARTYVAKKEFKKAEFHIETALRIPQPTTAIITTPRDDEINTLLTLFLIYFEQKELKKALKVISKLYTIAPTAENKDKLEATTKLVKWHEWLKTVGELVSKLKENKQDEKILSLLASLPEELSRSQYADTLRKTYLPSKTWSSKSIVYYCGQTFEQWTPFSLKTGIGGSEEAVIYLSKLWVEMGYEVTVYGFPGAKEGLYDGVNYLNYYRFNPKDKFNILIGWRNPYFFRQNLVARKKILDLHDVPEPSGYDDQLELNKIFVKSEYHKTLLPKNVHKMVKILGNGIDTKLINSISGNSAPSKVFYGSSYDRGLYGLLKVWPEVIKYVPDAELHICYGWNLFESLYAHNPVMMNWMKEMQKMMTYKGIIHHGRVGKKELFTIAKNCGVWAYPTTFEEIDCITGKYTQALGLTPVVFNYAALETTVQFGTKIELDPHDPKSMNTYTKELIKQMRHPQDTLRMTQWAQNEFMWERIAEGWVHEFEA